MGEGEKCGVVDRRERGFGYLGDVMREEIEKSGWGMGLLYTRTMD